MIPQIEINLALILFFPWFAILGALFWLYPRQPRGTGRRVFDTASLGLAVAASAWGMQWSFLHADPNAGAIWKQVLATMIAYGFFLFVMMLAVLLRYWMYSNASTRMDSQA